MVRRHCYYGNCRSEDVQQHGYSMYDNKVTSDDHVLISFLYFVKSEFNTTVTMVMALS